MAKRIRETGTFGHNQGDGFVRTIDGKAWLYMLMPSQPSVRDAADWEERERAAAPWFAIMQGLADLVPRGGVNNRKLVKGFYRQVHILAVSSPRPFLPSPTLDRNTRSLLAREQAGLTVHDRFTLFGVRLDAASDAKGVAGLKATMADAEGWTPDEAFDKDLKRIRSILSSAGCRTADEPTMQRAFAWWPADLKPERLPVMVEPGHMHMFPSYRACRLASKFKRTRIDCSSWESRIKGSYAFTCATFGVLPFKGEDERARMDSDWAATLLASREGLGGGAVALSIRGLVEPGELSREQIDKDKDKVLDKAYEQATAGHMANTRVAGELQTASTLYNRDGKPWPTLIEGNVTAAMPGMIENSNEIPYPGRLTLNPDRQQYAFEAMQIGSDIEYNPSPVYWPTPILAYAGINGRSVAGDDTGRGLASDFPGALTGLTESDRQPVYDTPFYEWNGVKGNTRRLTLLLGATGSGKAFSISSQFSVPPQPRFPQGGLVALRDLKIGDLLYSRDGKTYPITDLSPIRSDDLYEVSFSDGQTVKASGDHQWCAWTWTDRNWSRTVKHVKSLERRRLVARIQKDLRDAADRHDPTDMATLDELAEEAAPLLAPLVRSNKTWVYNALRLADTPSRTVERVVVWKRPRTVYETRPVLAWLRDRWSDSAQRAANQAAIDRLLAGPLPETIGVTELLDLFDPRPAESALRGLLRRYDGPKREEPARTTKRFAAYPTARALNDIADRLGWRYRDDPGARHGEQVVTTRDMLTAGIREKGGQTRWAIRATKPIEGVELDLPLDPWCLGAWLADGAAVEGEITSDPANGDLDHARRRFERAGFETADRSASKTFGVHGLRPILKRLGLYGNKHIPEFYQHASVGQRLELVRGLLDQDGTIDEHGSIEFTQSVDHKPIMDGLVRLLRSLGVVVHEPTRSEAGYMKDGVRHPTAGRLRLTFTTDLDVFSLERKRARLPKTLRGTARWLYVTDIRPIPDEPHRCLSIASPDHTYLVAGSIPTHNTRLGLHLAAQQGRLPNPDGSRTTPIIFWDPKANSSDFEPFVRRRHGKVVKLDRPDAKGVLDPIRCIPADQRGTIMQTSVNMLSQIASGRVGDRTWEIAITSIIGFGVRHGAGSLGEAVDMACRERESNGREAATISADAPAIRQNLDRLLLNDPLMPLIYGTGHIGPRLAASEGLTLLSAGKLNVIGDAKDDTALSAVQRWVCRMAAVAASGLLIGRNGILYVDEAWSLLQDDYGRVLVNQMGRLMRDQHYSMTMLSQKAGDFVEAGIGDYVGKIYALAIGGGNEGAGRDSEAQAVCRLMHQPLDGRMHDRMMRDRVLDPDSQASDWESLYPLISPETGMLERGAVAYMQVGQTSSAIPVEIRIDPKLV